MATTVTDSKQQARDKVYAGAVAVVGIGEDEDQINPRKEAVLAAIRTGFSIPKALQIGDRASLYRRAEKYLKFGEEEYINGLPHSEITHQEEDPAAILRVVDREFPNNHGIEYMELRNPDWRWIAKALLFDIYPTYAGNDPAAPYEQWHEEMPSIWLPVYGLTEDGVDKNYGVESSRDYPSFSYQHSKLYVWYMKTDIRYERDDPNDPDLITNTITWEREVRLEYDVPANIIPPRNRPMWQITVRVDDPDNPGQPGHLEYYWYEMGSNKEPSLEISIAQYDGQDFYPMAFLQYNDTRFDVNPKSELATDVTDMLDIIGLNAEDLADKLLDPETTGLESNNTIHELVILFGAKLVSKQNSSKAYWFDLMLEWKKVYNVDIMRLAQLYQVRAAMGRPPKGWPTLQELKDSGYRTKHAKGSRLQIAEDAEYDKSQTNGYRSSNYVSAISYAKFNEVYNKDLAPGDYQIDYLNTDAPAAKRLYQKHMEQLFDNSGGTHHKTHKLFGATSAQHYVDILVKEHRGNLGFSTAKGLLVITHVTDHVEYEQILVFQYQQTHYMHAGGEEREAVLNPNEENGRLNIVFPIEKGRMQDLTYSEKESLMQESLCACWYISQYQKLKWYQRSWFRVVLIIVAVVMIFFAPQVSEAIRNMLPLLAAYASAKTIFLIGFSLLLGQLEQNDLIRALQLITAVYSIGQGFATSFAGGFTVSFNNIVRLIELSSQVLRLGYGYYQTEKMEELQMEYEEWSKSQREKQEELEAAWAGLSPSARLDAQDIYRRLLSFTESPEAFFNRTLNADPGAAAYALVKGFYDKAVELPKFLGDPNILDSQFESALGHPLRLTDG